MALAGATVGSGTLITPGGQLGPPGAQGATGPPGPQGVGVVIKGTVANHAALPTTGNTVGDVWITADTGHGWIWQSNNTWNDIGPIQGPVGPQGPPGAQGATGASGAAGTPGAAATISVGSTQTGASGTSASVTNVGSSSAAVFNFVIPQGIQGIQGATGAQGQQGIQGVQGPIGTTGSQGPIGVTGPPGSNSWTLTTANFTVPNVGSAVTVSVQDATWATVGEFVWVATAGGDANTPMALQVTAKTATSVTLLNPPASGMSVSTDAGNLLTLGSDKLGYLGNSAIILDQIGVPTDITRLNASTTSHGLLAKVSGNATDYVAGNNTCQPLAPSDGNHYGRYNGAWSNLDSLYALLSSFTASSNWVRLAGLLVNWGYVGGGTDMATVTFVQPFTAAPSVIVTPDGGGMPTTSTLEYSVASVTTTNFKIQPRYCNSGGAVGVATQNFYWIAIGRG